jgi:1,4-alpha-glucan branching enzyme
VLSFRRQTADGAQQIAVIMNMTPVPRPFYRVGLPKGGKWREVLNSDSKLYGGSNKGNLGRVTAQPIPMHNQSHSAEFLLPPLSVIAFQAE